MFPSAYEYTSDFVWSNTVQQAACACFDYFKWGDYLTGNGNDHPEGGYIDRDYFGLALACSTGILNEVPLSYCAHWGCPDEISRRRMSLVNCYGDAGSPLYGMVEDMQHRDCDVLMLYPLDLTAVAERFGSWMTQYGYTNYVTAEKLLERGQVRNGAIELAGRKFHTLAATFEPFPSHRLLAMMKALAEQGGRVIWSGPPPVVAWEGDAVLPEWETLFGVDYKPLQQEGVLAPGRQIVFEGPFAAIPAQTILTDFLVDRVYPVAPRDGTATAGRMKGAIVATMRKLQGGGTATFLGYRPRDDQASSLGYEQRNWFEILDRLGAYPGTHPGAMPSDNTEVVSRSTPYLACRFPNGAVAVSRHFHDMEENWPGGFARNQKEDAELMKQNPPPSEELVLKGFRANGHNVTYSGEQAMVFRTNAHGALIAFAGANCDSIVVDGKETVFADRKIGGVAWAPVQPERRVPNGALLQIMVYGTGDLRIPIGDLPANLALVTEGATPGSRGDAVKSRVDSGTLVFTVTARENGRWLYAVPAAP